jgi:hypothetical protein
MLALPDMRMRLSALFVGLTPCTVQVTRAIALAFVLLTGACASTPRERGSQEAAKKSLRGGIAEFRVTSYDGRKLKGRVLLGATASFVSSLMRMNKASGAHGGTGPSLVRGQNAAASCASGCAPKGARKLLLAAMDGLCECFFNLDSC